MGPAQESEGGARASPPRRGTWYQLHRYSRLVRTEHQRAVDCGGTLSLSSRPGYRHEGRMEPPGPNQWTHDATPAHLQAALEGSLRRLRLNRIDIYQLQAPDPNVSLEASVETLAELQRKGKIRLIALSNVTKEHIERARKIVLIVSIQNRYSFVDREWNYVVDHCERNGIAFIPWFPLGGGKVAGDLLAKVAKRHRTTPTQIALAWVLKRSPIMLPIPGTSSAEHLEENIAAASLQLVEKEYQELSDVSQRVG
jgi:pyridoxine 4-dehydrogenase